MYFVAVKVQQHWFIPFQPTAGGKDRQAEFRTLKEAEKFADTLRATKGRVYDRILILDSTE
jgi:hypothetical protein